MTPDTVDFLLFRGSLYLKMKEFSKAVKDFNDVIERIDPGNAEAYKWKAKWYIDQNKYTEALSDLNMCITLDPSNVSCIHNRGFVHQELGKTTLAIEDYLVVKELKPDNVDAYLNLGRIYHFDLKDYQKALEFYKQAIVLDPNRDCGFYLRALVYKELGLTDKAKEDLQFCTTLTELTCCKQELENLSGDKTTQD